MNIVHCIRSVYVFHFIAPIKIIFFIKSMIAKYNLHYDQGNTGKIYLSATDTYWAGMLP